MIYHNLIKTSENTEQAPPAQGETPRPQQQSPVKVHENYNGTQENPRTEKLVVVEGPLSKIYTDALNAVYAQESQANDAIVAAQYLSNVQTRQPDVYVYASDVKSLDSGNINQEFESLRLALDSRKGGANVVVLESNGQVTKRLALLDNYARQKGSKVVYSRKAAMEAIASQTKARA